MDVDTVQQRTGQPVAVPVQDVGAAGAFVVGVPEVAAGTGIHGGHQHAGGRIGEALPGTGDGHAAVLQGLAQHFQRVLAEFGQLVEEEHAAMGQAHLTGQGMQAAAHQGCLRDRVVRRPEGPHAHQPLPGGQLARHAVDLGDFQGFFKVQGRQDGGQTLGQHGPVSTY